MIASIFKLKDIINAHNNKKMPLWIKPPLDLDLDLSQNKWLFIFLLQRFIDDENQTVDALPPIEHSINLEICKKGLRIYDEYRHTKFSRIFIMGTESEQAYERIKTYVPMILADKQISDTYPLEGFLVKRGFSENHLMDLVSDLKCHLFMVIPSQMYQCTNGMFINSSYRERDFISWYHVLSSIENITPYEFCIVTIFAHASKKVRNLWMPYLNSKFIRTAIKQHLYSNKHQDAEKKLMRIIEEDINETNIQHYSKLSFQMVHNILKSNH
jgi:hypothetical protein